MRLGLITETFAPEMNGVSHTLGHWVQGLQERDVQIDLVRPRLAGHSLPAHHWPSLAAPLPGYAGLQFGWRLPQSVRRHWASSPPDLLYIATQGPLGLSALRYAQRHNLPVVAGYHTHFADYLPAYRLGFLQGSALRYLRWFHNQAQCTLAPTEAQCQALTDQGFERVQCLGRGVDTQLFHPYQRSWMLRQRLGLGAQQLLVGYVGRLAAEKNMLLLLRAFSEIQQVRPDARLVLIGDGPFRSEIQQRCPQAICVGWQQGIELARFYASLDLMLFPSLTDTYGNVVAEAMASGIPVLAFDRAAAQKLIQNRVNGWSVAAPPHQASAAELKAADTRFCLAAQQMVKEGSRLPQIGQAAYLSVQSLSWEAVNQQLYQLLSSVLRKEKDNEHQKSFCSAGASLD
ncbi:glycosyltransferase family 4 protein [Marinospirillum sp.]|uniref:glycosyltransferase family 4 protein n=1 Tax=Marinospirillum sp. TaxID=2183934 RepID=UPI003A8B1FA3